MNSLYETRELALAAPGEVYLHFKGGIYRVLHRGVLQSGTLEPMVIYEHLWPHSHALYARLESEWNDSVRWLDGRLLPRFLHVIGGDDPLLRVQDIPPVAEERT